MHTMKITAGLGCADDYIRFCEAGADECFCGYVPLAWAERYGLLSPLNRREVNFYNVQIGAKSELEILRGMVQAYGKRVHLTFNSLYYTPEQYPVLADIIAQCMELGFESFILADPALLVYLRQQGMDCEVHISGEFGEINHCAAEAFLPLAPSRIIFPRKNSAADMAQCIAYLKEKGVSMEYEAFALNELCQFSGSFCNSFHCDELGHLCRTPYWLGGVEREEECVWELVSGSGDTAEQRGEEEALPPLGLTGCGLCALPELGQAGITHLKLVGRGNYADCMERDIRAVCLALNILDDVRDAGAYRKEMKRRLFAGGCPKQCYYLGEYPL